MTDNELEMRDILIRLDQKVTDGFQRWPTELNKVEANMLSKLNERAHIQDAQEVRLRAVENKITIFEGNKQGFFGAGKALHWGAGMLIGVLALLGFQVGIQPKIQRGAPTAASAPLATRV